MSRLRGKAAFTLLELLTVVGIIAVLTAVAIPVFGDMRGKAEAAVCQSNLDAARRQIIHEVILDAPKNGTEKLNIADSIMKTLGATGSNYIFKGLCPSGGEYTVAFAGDADVEVFCTEHGGKAWERGQTYAVGDTMTSNGFVFECLRAHTTGTTSRTRDPSLRSNKSTWQVVGYTGSPLPYSSTVRYAVGMEVTYKGKTYVRTDFNLVGGQVPYEERSSDYWTLVSDTVPVNYVP